MTFFVYSVGHHVLHLFVLCYFGKVATSSFQNLSDVLYASDWTELSVEQQKYLVLMMSNAQKPMHYNGFGVVVLDLRTFINVFIFEFEFGRRCDIDS